MNQRSLFAYGSLVDPACVSEVLGRTHLGERLAARLDGYQRIVSSTYPYPYVVPSPGHSVDGVLITELSADDLHLLDRYEDVGGGDYQRATVEVDAFGCGSQPMHFQADVYIAGPALQVSEPSTQASTASTES